MTKPKKEVEAPANSSYEEILLAHERLILEEVHEEALEYLTSARKIRFVSFISTSNGKGRRKRAKREVNFLVDLSAVNGPITYQVRNGEIRPRRSNQGLSPDMLARETLVFLPEDERTPDALLQHVMDRTRKLPKFK